MFGWKVLVFLYCLAGGGGAGRHGQREARLAAHLGRVVADPLAERHHRAQVVVPGPFGQLGGGRPAAGRGQRLADGEGYPAHEDGDQGTDHADRAEPEEPADPAPSPPGAAALPPAPPEPPDHPDRGRARAAGRARPRRRCSGSPCRALRIPRRGLRSGHRGSRAGRAQGRTGTAVPRSGLTRYDQARMDRARTTPARTRRLAGRRGGVRVVALATSSTYLPTPSRWSTGST